MGKKQQVEHNYHQDWYVTNLFAIQFHYFWTAIAVFTRSPVALEDLKSFGVLQLPSRSMLQSHTGTFLHEPGNSSDCIGNQLANYIHVSSRGV